jgi:hypothetical protein
MTSPAGLSTEQEEEERMKRMIIAAVLGLVLAASSASASGCGGGGFGGSVGVNAQWGPPGGACPGVLGPWYLYWPYEAHFAMPAHPQFPYWPTQTLPGGASAVVAPTVYPNYWK